MSFAACVVQPPLGFFSRLSRTDFLLSFALLLVLFIGPTFSSTRQHVWSRRLLIIKVGYLKLQF